MGLSYSEQRSLQKNIEDVCKKTDAGGNEAEIDLSLVGEVELSEILELRQEIENMTSLPCPAQSKSLVKKINKFEYRLERAVMRMAELGTVDEEFEFDNLNEPLDNNPGALAEMQKETVLPEGSRSMSEAVDKNPGALAEVQKETVLPEVSRSMSEDLGKNPGALAEVQKETVLPEFDNRRS